MYEVKMTEENVCRMFESTKRMKKVVWYHYTNVYTTLFVCVRKKMEKNGERVQQVSDITLIIVSGSRSKRM